MNETQIEKELMDWYVALATNTTSKEKCIETAKKFDKMAEWYKGIIETYQRKVDHFKNLQRIAEAAAEANKRLAE